MLGCIYQKVGQGQFVSGWPEKEAILNWVTVGVPANFSYPGMRECDRGQCLDHRHELEISHFPFFISICFSTNTYSVRERDTGLMLPLPLGAKPNWRLKNGTITLQTGPMAKRQAEATAGKGGLWLGYRFWILLARKTRTLWKSGYRHTYKHTVVQAFQA